MRNGLKLVLAALACMTMVACSLPRGAGVEREVVSNRQVENGDFAVYPITRAFLPSVSEWAITGERRRSWIGASAGSNGRTIKAGDTVQIVIWDSSDNSLLLTPGQRQVVMPPMRVSPEGSIFLPYVGRVNISGATPESARSRVQNALAAVAPTAQAQLALEEGRSNAVDLVGGVSAPGSYPMPDNNFTVLSLIAVGGGVRSGLNNPQIKLLRGGTTYRTSIDRLYEESSLDTRLRGGDKVIVEDDDRYFLSVGAAGQEALHPFPKDVVTALDAISIAGGVDDRRADPQGVLILREYPRSALAAGQRGPREERVIFTLDLTEADGLFSARNFRVNSGDVIYVSESPIGNVQTVFSLIGSVFGFVRAANSLND